MIDFVVYAAHYKESERGRLETAGIETVTLGTAGVSHQSGRRCVLRMPRSTPREYVAAYEWCDSLGLRPEGSFADYAVLSDFALHHAVLMAEFPPAFSVPREFDLARLTSRLRTEFEGPVFVRTDQESAAKYLGFDACVIRAFDEEDVRVVLDATATAVTNFSRYQFKALVDSECDEDGQPVEVRAIGWDGTLRYGLTTAIGPRYGVFDSFLNRCFRRLQMAGVTGPAVVDASISREGEPYLVELKDLSCSSIEGLAGLLLIL